jgi:hypothetical protein
LQLNASSHVARIHLVEGQPTGTGSILLTVNNTEVSVPTSLYPTAGEINSELQSLLRRAAFDVRKVDQFLQVRATVPVDGIRRVQFRSTDPGIRRSDLSLLPEGDTALVPGVISPPLPTE